MTNEEKQQIIAEVIAAIKTNSKTISQLTAVNEMSDSDYIELSGGRKASYAVLIARIVQALNGKVSATDVSNAITVALEGYVSAAGLSEYLSSSFARLLDDGKQDHAQMRIVPLASMGDNLDGVDGDTRDYTPQVGDLFIQNNFILRKTESGSTDGCSPSAGVVYINCFTKRFYQWNGTAMEEINERIAEYLKKYTISSMNAQSYTGLTEGTVVYNPVEKKLAYKKAIGFVEYNPDPNMVYADLSSGKCVAWNPATTSWTELGGGSGGIDPSVYDVIRYNVNTIQAKVDQLIGVLAGIAIDGTKPSVIGALTWPAIGNIPQLLSPSGPINVGAAEEGGSVSKTVRIQGANLTKTLWIEIGGTGFSASVQSVTASQANAGIDITVTYTDTGAETASGTIRFANNDGIDVTFALSASQSSSEPEPEPDTDPVDGYITDNLILHLDGLNQNNSNASWPDVAAGASGRAFALSQDYSNKQAKGYLFSQASENAVCSADILSSLDYKSCTIEVLFTPGNGFLGSSSAPLFLTSQDDKIAAVLYVKDGVTYAIFASYMSSGSASVNTWQIPSSVVFTEGVPVAMSINDDRIMVNGVVLSSSKSGKKIGRSSSAMEVGARHTTTPVTFADRSACATIHEVRIYTTKLSEKQMRDNQKYDMSKYSFSTTIADENS